MNKNWTRLLTMSLVATAVVFSSCRKDGDDNGPGTTTPGGSFGGTVKTFEPQASTVGGAGDSITIEGTGLNNVTTVTFGGGSVDVTTFLYQDATQIRLLVPTGVTSGTLTLTDASGSLVLAQPFTVTTVGELLIADFDNGGVRRVTTQGNLASGWWNAFSGASIGNPRDAEGVASSYSGVTSSPAGGNFLYLDANATAAGGYLGTTHNFTLTNDGETAWAPYDELTIGALADIGIPLRNPLNWSTPPTASNVCIGFYWRTTTPANITGASVGLGFTGMAGDGSEQFRGFPPIDNTWTWNTVTFDVLRDGYGGGVAPTGADIQTFDQVSFNFDAVGAGDIKVFIDHVVIAQGGCPQEPGQ